MENINLNQHNLFGRRSISSIGFDETQIIKDILELHANGNYIDCDPTYSIGVFYKKIPKPKHRFDINPQAKGVLRSSADDLPLKDNSINVIMFDPPFIVAKDCSTKTCKMSKRFSKFNTRSELLNFYKSSLVEFDRVLKKNGIIIFKNQDVICTDNFQLFSHCHIHQMVQKTNLYVKDLFIYCAKQRLVNHNHKQHHARKFHSYFWVIQKSSMSRFNLP